ncbi:MAG: hypothetical protein AMXMBFR58_26270 [Phycisphaerae bacterium]|nr:hypothetical protein [Phycisphaerales bacterium]MCK6476413.1 hypothetical protein [Phycisphaerales bacterium]
MLVAALSVIGGVLLAWHMVNPATISGTSTPELVLVLGLLVLPAAALGAWHADRIAESCAPAATRKRD